MSKKRGPNFSCNEKEVLIHLIHKYKDVVENKKTDAVTTANKNLGWRKLTEEFNSLSSFSVRNIEQLKTCWDNIKRNTRKDKAKTKKEIILTGGGRPHFPPPEPFQNQVEELLGPTLSGLENPFDSDSQYEEQTGATTTLLENEIEETENDPAGSSEKSMSQNDEGSTIIPADKDKNVWKGWSPAALKTKVADTLAVNKKDSPLWLQRRRPKASLHDNLLQSKLELVELMKKNAESEAKIKNRILEEQLNQEKIKTVLLELQLLKAQKEQ